MSEVAINPLAGLDASLPETAVRDHVAVLVRGGAVPVEAANAALASRGAAPLKLDSKEMAETAKAALMNDETFRAAYLAGDPAAIAALFQADVRLQQTTGKLTDRNPAPADYNLRVAQSLAHDAPVESVQIYGDDLAKLSADLRLSKENAQAFVDQHLAAFNREAFATPEQNEAYANEQTALLHKLLGEGAEDKLKAASATLNAVSGRKLDLSAIVKTNGAELALTLYHQAQALARQKR